jgi:hypothetical protein
MDLNLKASLNTFEVTRHNFGVTIKTNPLEAQDIITKMTPMLLRAFAALNDNIEMICILLRKLKKSIYDYENYEKIKKWYQPKIPDTTKITELLEEVENLLHVCIRLKWEMDFFCGLYKELAEKQAPCDLGIEPHNYNEFDNNIGFKNMERKFNQLQINNEWHELKIKCKTLNIPFKGY